MLKEYMKIEKIKNMFSLINKYNFEEKKEINNCNQIIHEYLNRTMIFISVYGLEGIRDKVLYCINFIIDQYINDINDDTKYQLRELIIAINAYPLLSKVSVPREIVKDYFEQLKINIRKYGKFYYTDKQIELYSKIYLQKDDIVFSAPTSYGKTHLSIMTIIDMIKDNQIKNVLIIVPTKALINDYKKTINKLNNHTKINVLESPYIHPNFNEKNFFIYTQERTLVAIDYAHMKDKIDIILIDEAQSLADVLNDRTLLLIKTLNYFENTPKIYLAPFVKNIYENVISKLVNSSKTQVSIELNSSDSLVSNNKYIVDITQSNKIIWYDATFATSEKDIRKIKEYNTNKLPLLTDDTYSNAIDIILDRYDCFVKKNEKSIIYIASKSESMKITLKIYNRLEDKEYPKSPRIKALIDHLQNNIHEKFLMLKFIERGVAYHNAYLDSYTKRQLEYIIGSNENYIDKLICTSTIESGVNLSAKNIFVLIKRNLQGNQPEIKYSNLLGRAARISNNTQGNLFYIKMKEKSTKYESEFYKSSEVKEITTTKIKLDDISKETNITYQSFLEDVDINNELKEEFLTNNHFYEDDGVLTNGNIILHKRISNGLDYYIDTNSIIRSEKIIKQLNEATMNKYLNCLGNYDDTKDFIGFLSYCYDWDKTCNTTIRSRMKNTKLIATMITYIVQGRSIKDMVNNRIEKMNKGEYKLYVYTEKNYVKQIENHENNYDENYELFDKDNLEHMNCLIINSLDQSQNLIEFHVKKYIQDFYYRVRKIHGDFLENNNIGNFLEFSAIDEKKIILIENGIIDNFALVEFSKKEYNEFYNDRKINLRGLLDCIEKKYTDESPYYYAISDMLN